MIGAGRGTRTGGFTILELLAAMALLSALGALLLQLIRGSFDLYQQGDRRGDLYANAIPVFELLEKDLRTVDSGPDGRFLLVADALGGGKGSGDGFLLRMVRTVPGGEQKHFVLRKAGTTPGAESPFTGEDPGLGQRKEIVPPSGLIEVMWALVQDPRDPVGVLTLFRGTRAPVLGAGSYFANEAPDAAWVRANLRPVATGILGLWFLCETQETEDWGEDDVIDGKGDGHLSSLEWDSTRGILSKSRFPLARGASSLLDSRDDVYPRRVRIVLHVARGARPDARLRRMLLPDVQVVELDSTQNFPVDVDERDRYVKIGGEWVLVVDHDGSSARVRRRRRKTGGIKSNHHVGDPVFVGRVFRKTILMPAWRSHWTEEER